MNVQYEAHTLCHEICFISLLEAKELQQSDNSTTEFNICHSCYVDVFKKEVCSIVVGVVLMNINEVITSMLTC